MNWIIAYLWDFAPVFAGLAFFYAVSSIKISRNKIEIHVNDRQRRNVENIENNLNFGSFVNEMEEDIFSSFAKEELITNGMFEGRKLRGYHRLCAESLGVVDLRNRNFIKFLFEVAPKKNITIFSRDLYETMDCVLDFSEFSGIMLSHAMNSSLRIVTVY